MGALLAEQRLKMGPAFRGHRMELQSGERSCFRRRHAFFSFASLATLLTPPANVSAAFDYPLRCFLAAILPASASVSKGRRPRPP
jgi:hypothetical protein